MAVSVRDNLDKEKSTQLFQKQDTHFLDDCINFSDYSVLKYNYSVDYKISQTSTLEKKALFLLTCPHSLTSPPRIRETFTGHSSHIYYPNTLINLSSYHLSLYDKHAFICYFILCISHKDVSSMRAGILFIFVVSCSFLSLSHGICKMKVHSIHIC